MIENIHRSQRRGQITRVIAPIKLSQWHRKVVLSRMAHLCSPILEHYQHDLVLLTESLEQRLYFATQHSPPNAQHTHLTHSHIVQRKLLTDMPYAAALCAPWPQIEDYQNDNDIKKYAEWLGLIIICCCQLHIFEYQQLAIDSALREIRLIATNPKHSKIFPLLPCITNTHSLANLGKQLESLRLNYSHKSQEYKYIGYLSLMIRDLAQLTKGRVRRRKTYTPKFNEPEIITTTPLEALDDSELKIEKLNTRQESSDAETEDESKRVERNLTLRISDPHQPQKTLAMKAIQSQLIAERISNRQKSLPCSYDQATEWDINHLIQHCMEQWYQQDVIANWILLVLITGREPTWLHARAIQSLLFHTVKDEHYLCLDHYVPASSQSNAVNELLPEVSKHLFLPLPIALYEWLDVFDPATSPPTPSEIQAWLKPINKKHSSRLTLGRVVRYLEHWSLNNGADRVIIALIRGESYQSRPALAYSHLHKSKILDHHYRYMNTIFTLADRDPWLIEPQQTQQALGSRLHLPSSVLHHIFSLLAQPLKQKNNIWEFHNHYVCYVWALLTFSTGHRDVTAPMGKLTDYNSYQHTWWISDKERRHGLAARTLVIPPTAAKQVNDYLRHLRKLSAHSDFLSPNIAERCQQALDGSGNLLFAITDKRNKKASSDLTPALLDNLLQNRLPWARNWARHHLRSELAKRNVYPEVIDGWMGHEEIGEEALAQHSFLSMYEYRELADTIESILNTHKIEALSGWSTH